MKITGIRIIDDFGTSLIKVYNHSLYWKMREIVVEPHSRFPKIIKCIFWECKIVCVNRYCMNLLYAPYWGKQR